MLRSKTIPARLGRVGLAAVVAAAGSVTLFTGVGNAAPATYTAVPNTGPAGNAAYVIQLTGTGFANAAGVSQVSAVIFATTCGLTNGATTGTAATRFNVISATRMGVTTPSLTISTGTSLALKACVFDTTGGASAHALLGSAAYTVYNAPTISAATAPASGPAFGGNTIAITGTNFTTKSTVKIDGVSATNVKVTGTTSITATVPAHASSATAVQIVVTTEGGPNGTPGTASWDDYTYQNAIQVSPTFGAAGTVVDVKGVGFSSLDFATPTAAVYLVSGAAYDPTDDTHGAKTHAEAGTCGSVQVLSDTELVCVIPSISSQAYTITVVNDNAVDAQTATATYTQTVISSGATYTISPY